MIRVVPFQMAPLVALLFAAARLSQGCRAAEMPPSVRDGTYFGAAAEEKRTRHYYVAAEPVIWNFIPLRADPTCSVTGAVQRMTIPPAVMQHPSSQKLRYFQYADDNFEVRAAQLERLGILGPVLRGVVGEYLAVTFLNRTDRPLSMHPHGVKYDKESEGAAYLPEPGQGASVPPGSKFTYVWKLDEASGPAPGEPSSRAWLYHSHVVPGEEINLGLVGFIIVTDPERARPDGTPEDVDREMPVLLKIFDETGISDQEEEPPDASSKGRASRGERLAALAESVQALKRLEDSERHTVNGLSFANLQGWDMRQGERVRWYLFSLGSERDVHSAHWHGARVLEEGQRHTDVVELLPGSMKTADMLAERAGTWLFHCHVSEHMRRGMFCTYAIVSSNSPAPPEPFFSAQLPPESISILSAQMTRLDRSEDSLLRVNGEFSLINLPRLQGETIEVRYRKAAMTFHLDPNGRAQQNENRVALRLLRAGNGAFGVRLAFELILRVPSDQPGSSTPSHQTLHLRIAGHQLSAALP